MTDPNCLSEDELLGFHSGVLNADQAEEVAAHLQECVACEETLNRLEQQSDTFVERLRRSVAAGEFLTDERCREVVETLKQLPVQGSAAEEGSGVETHLISEGQSSSEWNDDTAQQLRDYRLQEKLGEGGMGAVYKAIHTKLDKEVALKILPADRLQDENAVARFEREMKAVGKLNDPHIVQATDAGEFDGTHFLVMEFVDGDDLSRLLEQRGPFEVADACEIIRQAATGLQHAHEHGLVHRDIKPSNLMLTRTGEVKLLDMGLALLEVDTDEPGELTNTGYIMGTADYISPEQIRDTHNVDIRTDLYSLGCTLFKLLTGRGPFEEKQYKKQFDKLTAHATIEPPDVSSLRADVPPELAQIVARLLSKNPSDRFQTPAELADALQPLTGGHNLAGAVGRPAEATVQTSQDDNTAYPVSSVYSDTALNPQSAGSGAEPPRRRKVGFGMWGLFAAVLLMGIITVSTKRGTVTVDIADQLADDVKVSITTENGERVVEVLDKAGNWTAKLAAGKYSLNVTGGDAGFQLKDKTLTVSRFGETVVEIDWVPKEPLAEVPDSSGLSDQERTRLLAEQILKLGGRLQITAEPIDYVRVDSLTDLPSGNFRLGSINLRGLKSVSDETIQKLVAISSQWQLHELDLSETSITDDCLKSLAEWDFHILKLENTKVAGPGLGALNKVPRLGELFLDNTDVSIAQFKLLPLDRLERLGLSNTPIDDGVLHYLIQFENLNWLNLGNTKISAKGLAALANLPNLEALQLNHYTIPLDPNGFQVLNRFPRLRRLEWRAPLSDQQFEHVVDISQLQFFSYLMSPTQSPDSIRVLKNLRLLETLELQWDQKAECDLTPLSNLDQVTKLQTYDSRIDDDDLKAIAGMESLRELTVPVVPNQQITDAGLQHLQTLTHLASLDLSGAKTITGDGVRKLSDALPGCRIIWDGGVFEPQSPDTPINYALSFDGEDDYVELPITYDGSHPLTIEMTVTPFANRLHALLSNVNFAEPSDLNGMNFNTYRDSWYFEFGKDTSYEGRPTRMPVVVNQPTRLAVVIDEEEARVYVDGQLASTQPNLYLPSKQKFALGGSSVQQIEGNPTGYQQSFLGTIDEVRFSRVARYSDNYQPTDRLQADEETIALYHFDRLENQVLTDHSGNGRDAIPHNVVMVPTSTKVDFAAERAAAKQMLELGGSVGLTIAHDSQVDLAGEISYVSSMEKLPDVNFMLRRVKLANHQNLGEGTLSALNRIMDLQYIDLYGSQLTGDVLKPLSQIPSLGQVQLRYSTVKDDDLRHLADNQSLNKIFLDGTAISDRGMLHLRNCNALQHLTVSRTEVTNEGLSKLAHLPLSWFGWSGSQIDQASLEIINNFESLESLGLGADHRKLDLAVLSELKHLKHLSIGDSNFRDADVPELYSLRTLESLHIGKSHVTGEGLFQLADKLNLETLWFSSNQIGEKELKALQQFSNLKVLHLELTNISEKQLEQLHETLPNCQIFWDGGTIETDTSAETPTNYALAFDGEDDYVEIPTLSRLYEADKPITIELIAKPEFNHDGEFQHQGILIGHGAYVLRLLRDSWGWSIWEGNGNNHYSINSKEKITRDHAIHLCGIFDGKSVRFYVNGREQTEGYRNRAAEIAQREPADSITPGKETPATTRIGANNWPDTAKMLESPLFHGTIDEVRISNIARYNEEFTPATRFEPDEHTLALYHFDEAEGDVLIDSSGNGHHGKIYGATWVPLVSPAQALVEREVAEQLQQRDVTVTIRCLDETYNRKLQPAEQLPETQFVVVNLEAVGNQHLTADQLRCLTQLRFVTLARFVDCPNLNSDFLQHMRHFHSLRNLSLRGIDFSDEGSTLVAAFPHLQKLHLADSGLTDRHLAQISEMRSLRVLNTAINDGVTDRGLSHLAKLPKLENLNLSHTQVTGSTLGELAGTTSLTDLNVSNCPISGAAIGELPKLQSLRALWIDRTGLTELEVDELRDALPECYIDFAGHDRSFAWYILRSGGSVTVETPDGRRSELDSSEALSAVGEFDLLEIDWSGCQLDPVSHDLVSPIIRIPKIRAIDLSRTDVRTEDFDYFPGFDGPHPSLKSLRLNETEIDHSTLTRLQLQNQLSELSIAGTPVTERDVMAFSKNVPGCRITWDGGVIEPQSSNTPNNYALSFDGEDDYVHLPDTLGYDGSHPLTIEGWLTPRIPTHGSAILAPDMHVVLHHQENGDYYHWQVHNQLQNATSNQQGFPAGSLTSDKMKTPGGRTHVAAVYDGHSISLFLNGRHAGTITGEPFRKHELNTRFLLGRPYSRDPLSHFHGIIDEVRISNVVRYDKEFTPEKRFDPDEYTLALYHFDEGEGDVLKDSSGNGHHGKIIGATRVNLTQQSQLYERDRELAKQLQQNNVVLWLRLTDSQNDVVLKGDTTLPEHDFTIFRADISRVAFVEQVLPVLAQATELERLIFLTEGVRAEQLEPLENLPKLTELQLNDSREISNDYLEILLQFFPKTEKLNLANSLISDRLTCLSQLSSLNSIVLNHTENADGVLEVLPETIQVDYFGIEVWNTMFDWDLLQPLIERGAYCLFDARPFVFEHGGRGTLMVDGKEFPLTPDGPVPARPEWGYVSELDFSDTDASTDTFRWLGPDVNPIVHPKQLQEISLAGTQVTDGVLKYFNHLPRLQRIDLSRTAITDQGLLQLSASPVIEFIDVRQTDVTPTAIAHLKSVQPECEILSDFTPEEIDNAPRLLHYDPTIPQTSPFDQLKREDIDPYELKVAGNGDSANSPEQLVGILGDSRLQHPHLGPNGPHLAFSADSKSLVSAGFDGRILTWDVESGRMQKSIQTNFSLLSINKLMNDENYVVMGNSGVHRIYDVETGQMTGELPAFGGYESFSADGRIGVSAGWDDAGLHRVWHVPQRRLLREQKLPNAAIKTVAVHPEGKSYALVSYGPEGNVWIYETQTGRKIREFNVPDNRLNVVEYSQDGQFLFGGTYYPGFVICWNLETGQTVWETQPHQAHVSSLSHSAIQDVLAVGYMQNGTVELLNAKTGKVAWEHVTPQVNWRTVKFSPDRRYLAAGSKDGLIEIWDVESGEELHSKRAFSSRITSSALSEDGRYLAVAESDGDVTVFDIVSGKIARHLQTDVIPFSVTIHSGLGVVYLGPSDPPYRIQAYSLTTGELLAESPWLKHRIGKLSMSADGQHLAATNANHKLFRLNPLTLDVELQWTELKRGGADHRISADGRYAVVFSRNAIRFHIYDFRENKHVYSSPQLPEKIIDAALSSDGTMVAVSLSQTEQSIRLWDWAEKRELAAFGSRHGNGDDPAHGLGYGYARTAYRMVFSPDGKTLYTAFDQGEVEVWDLDTIENPEADRTVIKVGGPMDGFYGLHVDPAGRHLITHNGNGTFFVLRLETKR